MHLDRVGLRAADERPARTHQGGFTPAPGRATMARGELPGNGFLDKDLRGPGDASGLVPGLPGRGW